MAVTIQNVIDARAPYYTSDTRISLLIPQALLYVGNVFAGDKKNLAQALIILHWMSQDDRNGGSSTGGSAVGGTIKREKEGQLEKEYMIDFTLTAKYPDLSQTRWGLEYIRLMNSCIIGIRNRFTTVED